MNAKQKHNLKIAVGLLPKLFVIFGSVTVVMFALFDPAGKRIVRNARAQVAHFYTQASDYIKAGISSPADEAVAPAATGNPPAADEVSIEQLAARKAAPPAPAPAETAPVTPDEPVAPEPVTPPAEEPQLTQLTLEEVIRTPSQWPRMVTIKEAAVFPAIVNGRIVGSVKAPAGVRAKPLSVQDGFITVQYQNATKVLPLAATDFVDQVEQMRGSAKAAGEPGPTAVASVSASPASESSEIAPKPAGAAKFTLLISSEKKRFDVERTKTSITQNTVESWGYSIAVVNKSFADIPDVEIRYQLFFKDESPGATSAAKQQRRSGSKTCELLKNNTTFAFDTEPVELTKTQLGGGYTYGNGAKARSRDSLSGVWVRALHAGNVIAEFSEPPGLRTKEKWD